jgi:hypothetical protein
MRENFFITTMPSYQRSIPVDNAGGSTVSANFSDAALEHIRLIRTDLARFRRRYPHISQSWITSQLLGEEQEAEVNSHLGHVLDQQISQYLPFGTYTGFENGREIQLVGDLDFVIDDSDENRDVRAIIDAAFEVGIEEDVSDLTEDSGLEEYSLSVSDFSSDADSDYEIFFGLGSEEDEDELVTMTM